MHPHHSEQEVDRQIQRKNLSEKESTQFCVQGKCQASFKRDLTWASKVASKRHLLKWVWGWDKGKGRVGDVGKDVP